MTWPRADPRLTRARIRRVSSLTTSVRTDLAGGGGDPSPLVPACSGMMLSIKTCFRSSPLQLSLHFTVLLVWVLIQWIFLLSRIIQLFAVSVLHLPLILAKGPIKASFSKSTGTVAQSWYSRLGSPIENILNHGHRWNKLQWQCMYNLYNLYFYVHTWILIVYCLKVRMPSTIHDHPWDELLSNLVSEKLPPNLGLYLIIDNIWQKRTFSNAIRTQSGSRQDNHQL